MAAVGVMWHEHSPDSGILWLCMKPRMRSILASGDAHRTLLPPGPSGMAIKIVLDLPAFCVFVDSMFAHNVS